jgi:hypothetical protein
MIASASLMNSSVMFKYLSSLPSRVWSNWSSIAPYAVGVDGVQPTRRQRRDLDPTALLRLVHDAQALVATEALDALVIEVNPSRRRIAVIRR